MQISLHFLSRARNFSCESFLFFLFLLFLLMARAYGGLALAVRSLRADVCSPCSVACLCVMPLPLSPSQQSRKRHAPARNRLNAGVAHAECSIPRLIPSLFCQLRSMLSSILFLIWLFRSVPLRLFWISTDKFR